MFHPDNIKNYTLDGTPVSISLHQYWQILGGAQGLAKALNVQLKGFWITQRWLVKAKAIPVQIKDLVCQKVSKWEPSKVKITS